MSTLEEYIENLASPDEADRSYAAEDIGYLNSPVGVPVLLARLGAEPSRSVRDAIFQALIRIDGDAAIEAAVQLLGSEDAQIRNQAVDALRHKGALAIPFLSKVMRDGNQHQRKLVLDVLSEIPDGDTGEIYSAALSDPDLNVVITALENLGRARPGAIGRDRFLSRIEELLKSSSHPMVIAACLESLAGIGKASSLAAIRKRFPNPANLPDFPLAPWLRAIAALGSEREFAEVASLLPMRNSHLRPAILDALKAIHRRCPFLDSSEALLSALWVIVESLDHPPESAVLRYQAVRVLGIWAGREDIRCFLISCMSSPERLIRLGAIEALRATVWPGLDTLLAARALVEPDAEILQALGSQTDGS